MRVSIQNLTKRFGDTTALKGVSLEIGSQELFFLLGPSGCGKTTLLRLIAGFYQPDGGELLFGGKLYRSPANRFVADFIGETNWLPANVEAILADAVLLQTEVGKITAATKLPFKAGEKVWLGFRPEAVQMGANGLNGFKTAIAHVSYLGEIEQYGLEIAPGRLIKAFEQNPLEIRQPGATLPVHVRPQDCLVLPEK